MKGLGKGLLVAAAATIISACNGDKVTAEKAEQNASTQPDLLEPALAPGDPQDFLDSLCRQCVDAEELLIEKQFQYNFQQSYALVVPDAKRTFQAILADKNLSADTSIQQAYELFTSDENITDEQKDRFYDFYYTLKQFLIHIDYPEGPTPTFDAISEHISALMAGRDYLDIPYYCSEAYLQNMDERIQQHEPQKQQQAWQQRLLFWIISAGERIL